MRQNADVEIRSPAGRSDQGEAAGEMKGDLAALPRAFDVRLIDVTGNAERIICEKRPFIGELSHLSLTRPTSWKRLSRGVCIELFAHLLRLLRNSIVTWNEKDSRITGPHREQFQGASTRGTVIVVFFIIFVFATPGGALWVMIARGAAAIPRSPRNYRHRYRESSSLVRVVQLHPTRNTFIGSNALVRCAPTGKWCICMRLDEPESSLRLKQSPAVPLSKMSSHALRKAARWIAGEGKEADGSITKGRFFEPDRRW